MNYRIALALVAGALTAGLAACGSRPEPGGTTSQAPGTALSGFGVPECDSYLPKYEACIDGKVPEMARAMVRQQLEASKAQWKQAAATPEGRSGLATACRAAEDAAKQAMRAYGCSW
jgi:hypothetical protein